MAYILIIASIYNGTALSTAEFTSKSNCEAAKNEFEQLPSTVYRKYAICVVK